MKLFLSMFVVSAVLIYGMFAAYAFVGGGVYRWCAGQSMQSPNWTCYQSKKLEYFVIFEKVGK